MDDRSTDAPDWRAHSVEDWRKLAEAAGITALEEQLEQLAEAHEFVLELATALLPPEKIDIDHLTWGDAQAEADAKTAEDRLRVAEQRFKMLVEQIPAVTFMAVLGDGKNEIYVSPHIEQMLGYSQREWLEDPFLWYWRLFPEDRKLWNEEFARGCRSGGPFRAECRFVARDGKTVWVHGEARLVRDARGRPQFLQGVAFDITESKRAQEILLREAVRDARVKEELEIARRVQMSLVPRDPSIEGLEIVASMDPAEEVGGDYYDFVPFDGGGWIAIGDVSGHGLNAGLVMMMLQSAMSALCRALPDASPRDVLVRLNELMYDNVRARLQSDDHVTLTLFRYAKNGSLSYAGAHEDLIIARRATGRIEVVRPPGTWLAARRDISRVTTDKMLKLEKGDVLVLYTDGLTESMSSRGEQYNFARLCETVEKLQKRSVQEIHDGVLASVKTFAARQDDDRTLVVLRQQ